VSKDQDFENWLLNRGGSLTRTLYIGLTVSRNCPIIGEQVAVNFVAQQVVMGTLWPAKNTLNLSFYYLQLKTKLGDHTFLLLLHCDKQVLTCNLTS